MKPTITHPRSGTMSIAARQSSSIIRGGGRVGCAFVITMLACLPAFVVQAQWERIPIQGGHFERLVKHPFKENELYGIVEQYGIYRSTDQGYTWANWMKSTPQRAWKNIYALTFAKDGTALMISDGYPYVSHDDGRTWKNIAGLFSKQASGSCFAQTDTTGRITLFNDRSKSFIYSSDLCRTWTEVFAPPDIRGTLLTAAMDRYHPGFLVLCGVKFISISFDTGSTWTTSTIQNPERAGFVALPRILVGGPSLRLGLWIDGMPLKVEPCYYESGDSGRTWKLISVRPPITTGGISRHSEFIPGDECDMYLIMLGDVYMSVDSGVHWRKLMEQCWSMAVYEDHIVGSFAMDGIKIAADGGDIWTNASVTMPDRLMPEVHFAVTRDTITALVVDVPGVGPVLRQLRQSSDRGLTWTTLFTTTSTLEQLTVTSNPSLRYYLLRNSGSELLRGGFGQEVPDTVLRLERTKSRSPVIHLFATDANTVYISAPDIGLYWSTDGGDTWGRSGIPWGDFAYFRAAPSKENRDRLLATAAMWDPMVPPSGGRFLTHNRGASWVPLDRDDDYSSPIFITGDVLFIEDGMSFSTDYGRTWVRNYSGIDTSLTGSQLGSFDTQGKLIAGCEKAWYMYSGDTWKELLGAGGERLGGMPTNRAAVDGDRLYVFRSYEGLYMTRSPTLTKIEVPEEIGQVPADLNVHPNPAWSHVVMARAPRIQQKPATLDVYDALGRRVTSFELGESDREISWDLTAPSGRRVPSGVYRLVMQSSEFILAKGTVTIY